MSNKIVYNSSISYLVDSNLVNDPSYNNTNNRISVAIHLQYSLQMQIGTQILAPVNMYVINIGSESEGFAGYCFVESGTYTENGETRKALKPLIDNLGNYITFADLYAAIGSNNASVNNQFMFGKYEDSKIIVTYNSAYYYVKVSISGQSVNVKNIYKYNPATGNFNASVETAADAAIRNAIATENFKTSGVSVVKTSFDANFLFSYNGEFYFVENNENSTETGKVYKFNGQLSSNSLKPYFETRNTSALTATTLVYNKATNQIINSTDAKLFAKINSMKNTVSISGKNIEVNLVKFVLDPVSGSSVSSGKTFFFKDNSGLYEYSNVKFENGNFVLNNATKLNYYYNEGSKTVEIRPSSTYYSTTSFKLLAYVNNNDQIVEIINKNAFVQYMPTGRKHIRNNLNQNTNSRLCCNNWWCKAWSLLNCWRQKK